jgi:hypothetical protein
MAKQLIEISYEKQPSRQANSPWNASRFFDDVKVPNVTNGPTEEGVFLKPFIL